MRFVNEPHVTAQPADASNFIGRVQRSEVLPTRVDGGLRAHRFSYEPGARSNWHTHEGEQAIFVVVGRGLVQRWGDDVALVGPGSWVHIEPGEKHWHGATADDIFVHLAVTATGGTIWHEPVDDATYRAANAG